MRQNTSKIALAAILMAVPGMVGAQFNTIRKTNTEGFEILTKGKESSLDANIQVVDSTINQIEPDRPIKDSVINYAPDKGQNGALRKKHLGFEKRSHDYTLYRESYPTTNYGSLPSLTIVDLLDEIRKNGIQHEKIVLAQAILETGWFTSSVCRHKNNLFGLTNPRTGQYYEFRHWTESVRAYYEKVQYRYKGGNYLLWLKNIGYAEDPRYVSSLIRILRQYMM